MYFGFIVPYGILLVVNAMIIYKATQFSRAQKADAALNSSKNRRKAQMTRMILFITFLYITLSFPGVIVTGYFFGIIYSHEAGSMIINLLNAIQFSYPALNFFILLFSNKLFAEEVKRLFLRLGNNSVSVTTRTKGSAALTQDKRRLSNTGNIVPLSNIQ